MSRTVLIVDDSLTERVVLKGFLKPEYDILEATSGEEGIEVLKKHFHRISAIVLDVVMPGMDGFEALRVIKQNANWLQIPVVITTGLDDEESREKAIASGADNFVTKPFNQKLLLHVIQNAVRLREMAALANNLWRDKLTNLLNRESFFIEAERMIKRRDEGYYILSCFDVENFKIINDQYGTETGDEVLKHIASCLNSFASLNKGLASRYMADKFVLLFPERLRDSRRIDDYIETLINPKCLTRPIRVRIGRYHVIDKTLSVSGMYDRASLAEDSIKGRFDVFRAEYTEDMREGLLREQEIVNDMVQALHDGEFETWFQPQYNHATGALIGAEALVRWRKNGKIIPPNNFIPVFEKSGFIYEVDQSVWRSVCAYLRKWLDEGKKPMPISVNISRYDLYQKDFLNVISGLVKEYGLPHDLLRLEITESAFSDSTNIITDIAGKLIASGFTVEIDDFGSGYSSLNTLKDVPASILKLDMRFFENTKNSERGGNIVESVVRMAKWLGMSVIAEGVEEKAQADYLKTIGCYYIQGYFYAKPMDAASYEKAMSQGATEAKLSRMETLETLNSNLFWDPKSMETLIFNSYVGGACIFEYHGGKSELLRVNDQYISEMHGLIPAGAKLKDSSILPFLDSQEKELIHDTLKQAAEQNKATSCEIHLTNGAQVEYIRFTSRVIARTEERILYYAVIVNITQQREAEQLALDVSERMTAIMNSTKVGITAYVVTPGKVECLFVNERFCEMLGYTREQFASEVRIPFDRIYPQDRDKAVEDMLKLKNVGQSATMQMRVFKRDGSLTWIRADISIVEFANVPHPVQLSNFIDVTEQVEAERKRNESAEQLSIIMSNINGSVSAFLLDEAGNTNLIFGNDKYYGIFGYSKEQAKEIHLDTMSCIIPEDFDGVIKKLHQLKNDGIPIDIDYRARKRDGSLIYVRAICSRMSMEGYGDEVIVSVETDITEQRTLQDQLRAVVDNINGGVSAVYLKDGAPEYILINDKYFDIIGYTREEFSNEVKNVFDIVHPDDRERVEKLVGIAAQTEKPFTMEYRIIRRNGAVRHILCTTNVTHLFGIVEPVQLAVSNDITVLRETQQKEHDLSVQMRTIMENIHGGVTATVFHDKNDVEMVFANDGFYELYGYTKELLEAELPNMLDLMLPEDREKTMETVERIVRERTCATYEYRCRKRDGSVMWSQVTNAVISLAGVGDTVLLAIVTDITALRLAEQKSAQATDRLKTVMNAMISGITAVAFHGGRTEFLFANERYYQMHGITREEYEQNELSESLALVHPDDRALMRELILNTTEIGQTREADYRILRPDGTVRWAKAVISVTSMVGVDVPVQVTIFRDINCEKEASEQLCFLNDSAHDILAQPDVDVALNGTLEKINAYFNADRSYVVEFDEIRKVTRNTYEVCKPNVKSQKDNLRDLAFMPSDEWFEALNGRGYMVVADVEALHGDQKALRELLAAQDIRSIIIVALKRDGKLIGFAGSDNPSNALDQVSRLTAVADYISVLLTRRDLLKSVEREANTARQLMDDTPGGFLRIQVFKDKTPVIVSFNKGFCRMVGMTSDEVIAAYGDDADKCLLPEDISAASREAAQAYAAFGQYTYKCRLRRKDGSFLWTMVFARFVKGGNGETFLNSYFTDITEQKNAERQQIELLDNMPSGAALYEFDGKNIKIIHINKRYWALVGRDGGEGLDVFDALHPDDRELVRQEIDSAIRQNRNADADCRILCGNGSYKPFHVTANITPSDGGVYLLYAAYTPIGDDAMSIQRMLPIALSTIVANTDAMSYVKDRDLRYICVSQSIANIAGVQNPRDLIGKSAEEFFAGTFADKFNEDDKHVLETGKSVLNILEHLPAANGSVCLARTSKFPILDARGNAVGVYCVSHDITQQKEKESQLELLSASIPGGLAAYSISKDGIKTLYFNVGYYAYSGYTREEYEGRIANDPLAMILQEDRPKMLAMVREFAAAKKDGQTGSCSYRVRTKNGGIRFMSMKAVLSQVGEDAYVLNAVQLDVTDQMLVENRRTQLLDNLPFGAALFSFEGDKTRPTCNGAKLVYINDGYCALFGYTREEYREYYTEPLRSVFGEDRHILNRQIARLISDATPVDCVFRVHTKGGGFKWVDCRATAIDYSHNSVMVNVMLIDVTHMQREKERLRIVTEELRLATAHAGRTICRYNIAKHTLTVAQEAAVRLDLPENMTNVPYAAVERGSVSEDTKDAYIAFFEGIIKGVKESSVSFCYLLNKRWRWLDAKASTISDSAGKPVSAIISYNDVTEQREKEAIYSRWQNSIAERPSDSYTLFRCNLSKSSSYESWEGDLLKLYFKEGKQTFDERTDEFVCQCVYAEDRERYRAFLRSDTMLAEYYRGHRTDAIEFRQQLDNGKIRWLKLSVDLVEYPHSDDVEAYLMYENIDERKRAEIRTIKRAETDPLTGVLNRATFAVRVNQIISQSLPGARHALLMIDIDSFKMVNDIFGHGAGDQALTNIADLLTRSSRGGDLVGRLGGDEFLVFLADVPNAATVAKKARLICELTRKDFSVNVRISSSIGVALYPQDGEGFESLYKTADDVLYRVKESGKNGYAFNHEEPVLDDDSPRQSQGKNNLSASVRGPRRILIVDDSKIDLEMLAKLFKNEYRVEKATDGAMAISKLRHFGTAISAVLLDLIMPGMDGYEVLKRIQQEESTRTIPVVVVTSDERRETALKVIRAGASDLVSKPVDPEILHIRVESAISRSENERLRAQNSYLSLRNAEVNSYKSALELSGILVITLDWGKNSFSYSPSVSASLAGEYDGKVFWRVLLSDMVTDSMTVQQMQRLVHEIADDRERTHGCMVARLKTNDGVYRLFDMNVFKEINDIGLAGEIIITLRDRSRFTPSSY